MGQHLPSVYEALGSNLLLKKQRKIGKEEQTEIREPHSPTLRKNSGPVGVVP